MLITIFAPAKVHLLEIAGVRDALFEANCKIAAGPIYRVQVVTELGTPAQTASGTTYLPDASIREAARPCDTLIVAGPYGVPERPSEDTMRWLRDQAAHARRYGSTCTGAFLLAEAGLLAGRTVTTHWEYAGRLAADYPDLRVEADRIFVRDGPVFSSAGVTAAIDLAFSLIEEDHGRALALRVARRLVVFLKRPGGQSQPLSSRCDSAHDGDCTAAASASKCSVSSEWPLHLSTRMTPACSSLSSRSPSASRECGSPSASMRRSTSSELGSLKSSPGRYMGLQARPGDT